MSQPPPRGAVVRVPGLTERVRWDIYEHVFRYPDTEVGGVFVGTRRPGDTPTIQDIVPAVQAQGDLTSLTFTHEAWEHIHAEIAERYPEREIVGWYHSHPGHGVFLSDHDLFIHENFFADATSVAFVVDPIRGEEGVFGWHDGRIVQLSASETLVEPLTGTAPRQQPEPPPPVHPPPPRRQPAQAWGSRGLIQEDAYPLAGYLVPALVGILLGVLLGLVIAA